VQKRISWESIRPWPLYVTAAMLPFSLAGTNVGKVLMLLFALAAVVEMAVRREKPQALLQLRTPLVVVVMLVVLTLSLAYTQAPMDDALHGLNKYTKLLVIPLVLLLVRSRREALIALGFYMAVQALVLLASYLLAMGVALPLLLKPLWIRIAPAAVSSSYLDQSIMTVGMAALAWHLRNDFPGRHGPRIAIGLVALCAVNVLLLLPGRSAQVALLAAMVLALFWAVPQRARPAAVLLPLLVVAAVMALSPHFRERTTAVATESIAYTNGDRSPTSSGIRLSLWHRALQAIAERPLSGHGVGSWNTVYRRMEGKQLSPVFATMHNPHQEYLLWGVHVGVGGIVLLLAFMAALVRDARPFRAEVRHATYSLLAILAVVCLFNSTLFDALIGDYFCFLLGVLLALGIAGAPPRPAGAAA
jgi:O-antigen ligase